MRVRHLRLEGTNRAIGSALARIAIRCHGVVSEMLREREEGQARRQARFARKHAPILWERSRGVAEALEIDADTYDTTALAYNQMAESAGGIGCSLVYYPPEVTRPGHPILARNYDFPLCTIAELLGVQGPDGGARPLMGDPYLVELHPSDGGYASLAMCSFDLLGGVLDGINACGVMVSANGDEIARAEQTKPVSSGVGFHELSCMRAVLDQCCTAREARRLLEEAGGYISMIPCHYLIADRSGDAFIFERDRNGDPVVIEVQGDPKVLTNHPLHRFPDRATFSEPHGVVDTGTTSFDRHIHLEDAVSCVEGPHTLDDIRRCCRTVTVGEVLSRLPEGPRQALCSSSGMARTLWHVIYDAAMTSMEIRFYVGESPTLGGGFREKFSGPFLLAL